LAGNRNLVDGWALFGAPPEKQSVVEERCLEDRVLIGRLGWLVDCGMAELPGLDDLMEGDRAVVLLHAVLGLGSPEEERHDGFPELDPRVALAAATWAAVAGGTEPRWSVEEGQLWIRSSEPVSQLPAWWLELFQAFPGLQVSTERLVLELGAKTAPPAGDAAEAGGRA